MIDIRKNALPVLMFWLLYGCSSHYTWVKPSDPKADNAFDLYECSNLALTSGAVFNQSDYQPPPAINAGPFSNDGCYNPNVSNVNCLSATPQPLVPDTFKTQLGEDSYQSFIDRCMQSRGWKKELEK